MKPSYQFKWKVVNIVDGDTRDVEIDIWFQMTVLKRVRLAWIDTPEMRGENKEAWKRAKAFCIKNYDWRHVVLRTEKESWKYGRYIAHIYYKIFWEEKRVSANEELVRKGYAKEKSF